MSSYECSHYQLLADSRPRYAAPAPDQDPACEVILIPATDPNHLPTDWEVWPIFQQAVLESLRAFPEAKAAATAAVRAKRQELKGRQSLHVPPGTVPDWAKVYQRY